MFSRIYTAFVYALCVFSIFAVATPFNTPTTTATSTTTVTVTQTATSSGATSTSCSTGALQCCNSVQSASNPAASLLLGLLGIVVQPITAEVGITCSPISVIGAGSSGCSANVVCCQDNAFGGVVSIGCLPVTL